MSSKFKKKIAERSTEELQEILREERDAYPREVIGIIEEVLAERGAEENTEPVSGESSTENSTYRPISSRTTERKALGLDKENRYRSLRITAGFIKVFSIIFLIGAGIFGFVYAGEDFISLALILFLAIVFVIPYFALSRIIHLFVDLEDNTRQTRDLLQKLTQKSNREE
ncbi:MAG: hypothetical protein ACOCQ1_04835 [Halanaerobiaceae bacterium]